MSIVSSPQQLEQMQAILTACFRLPFWESTIPGAVMEQILAHVRSGVVLETYDFVDVIREEEQCGWQVKSTRADTTVTWKRAKIPNAAELIEESKRSEDACQKLGDAIIAFCNQHAQKSMEQYQLREIGYARLILHDDGRINYFEKLLCSQDKPEIFTPEDFAWDWSSPKNVKAKEQLPALHGAQRATGEKWWAWHGLGENQLHFIGESKWWPENVADMLSFQRPNKVAKLSFDDLVQALNT